MLLKIERMPQNLSLLAKFEHKFANIVQILKNSLLQRRGFKVKTLKRNSELLAI